MPAQVLVLRDAASLIDAQTSGRIEYAVLSSMGYAAAQIMCQCLEPLAAPRSAEGAAGARSVLIADRQKVAAIAELAGTVVDWGPKGSLTGDLIPRVGMDIDGEGLSDVALAGAPAASFAEARRAFLAGDTVAMFAWDYADAGTDAEDGAYRNGLAARIRAEAVMDVAALWRSPLVPFGPHVVHDSVPDDLRAALTEMLVGLRDNGPEAYDAVSPALAGGFVAVDADDYEFAARIARARAGAR